MSQRSSETTSHQLSYIFGSPLFGGLWPESSFSTSTIEPVSNYCFFLFGFVSLHLSQGFRRVCVQSHHCGLQLGWDLSTNFGFWVGDTKSGECSIFKCQLLCFRCSPATLKFLVSINIFDMTGWCFMAAPKWQHRSSHRQPHSGAGLTKPVRRSGVKCATLQRNRVFALTN